jgi:hypothetical protein
VTLERELEQRARSLEGEVLSRVQYQRAERTVGAEHAVLHLVFLDFESGRRVAVGCGDAFGAHHGFGVTMREQRVIDHAFGEVVVAPSPQWRPLLGQTITAGRIRWGDVRQDLRSSFAIGVAIHSDHLRRRDYPGALELEVGPARVSFMAARRDRQGALVPFVNALLVTFA